MDFTKNLEAFRRDVNKVSRAFIVVGVLMVAIVAFSRFIFRGDFNSESSANSYVFGFF